MGRQFAGSYEPLTADKIGLRISPLATATTAIRMFHRNNGLRVSACDLAQFGLLHLRAG